MEFISNICFSFYKCIILPLFDILFGTSPNKTEHDQQQIICVENTNNTNKKTLLIGGCGIKFWYFAGIIQRHIELNKDYIHTFDKIIGISGGGLLACFVISNCDLLIIKHKIIEVTNTIKTNKVSIFKYLDIIKQFYKENLPDNAYILCSNKLHIQTIHLHSLSVVCFHTFSSNDDLIDKLMKSCHIPFLCNTITNEGYVDRMWNSGKNNCCYHSNNTEKLILDTNLSCFIDLLKFPDETFIQTQFQQGFNSIM
jgi:hypothetical protein